MDFNVALVPSKAGVYIFGLIKGITICRVSGTSEIVYVGSGNIQARLRAHQNPDWASWADSGWLISLVAGGRDLEVAWAEMEEVRARAVEGEILAKYLTDHHELPPANRQVPAISPVSGAVIALLSLPEDQRQRAIKLLQEAGGGADVVL